MRYLAKKRQNQQIQPHHTPQTPPPPGSNRRQVVMRQHSSQDHNARPTDMYGPRDAVTRPRPPPVNPRMDPDKEKPAGYDERRRQRELDRRKLVDEAQREARRETHIEHSNAAQRKYDYNNRGRRRSLSSDSDKRNIKKHARNTSETRGRHTPPEDTRKRKPTRTRSNSRDKSHNSNETKRRKRPDNSVDQSADRSASHIKELEFRARALQSLVNIKEEQNKKAIRKRDR